MSYIQGFARKQAVLIPETIEQLIAENNPVRFIDAFVNSQDIVAFGFKDIRLNKNGRPPFHPKDLFKLYIYGYLNKIRSSRSLEKECTRNVELMWLIKGLAPDHNTISTLGSAAMAFMREHGVLKDVYKESESTSHRTVRGKKITVRTFKAPNNELRDTHFAIG